MEKLYYRSLKEEDFKTWEDLAKKEFLENDFCDANFLEKNKSRIKGWVLLDNNKEWIGCCFISTRTRYYNENGVHFLEICTFPNYRNKGYGKYLVKIMFDNTLNSEKSVCINQDNIPSIRLFTEYGFKYFDKHKSGLWNIYKCDKSYYPEILKDVKIINID